MAEPNSTMPEEDRPQLGIEELHRQEDQAAGRTRGDHAGGRQIGRRLPGRTRGDHSDSSATGSQRARGDHADGRSADQGNLYTADELRDREPGRHKSSGGGNKDGDSGGKPDERLGKGYVDAAPNRLARVRRKFTRRRVAIGAAFGLFGVGGTVMLFMMLLPLKIENLVQNVENRYFATSENAVGNETDHLFKGWIKDNLALAMTKGACSRSSHVIISKDCTVHVAGNGKNPITNLYKTWSNAHLENKLADQYGIELKYDPGGRGTFYLKAPGISGEGAKIGDGVKGIDSAAFAAADRGTVRSTMRDAEEGMTLWEKAMFRYKVGTLLQEKYGIKRCIIFCSARDKFTDWKNNKKYAAKAVLVDRVIEPRSAALGAIISCLFDQNQCQDKEPSTTCTESECDALNGEPQTKASADVEEAVGKASSKFGSETADEVIKHINGIKEAGGIQNYMLKAILSKIFSKDISEKAVPVIGWLQMLDTISHLISAGAKATVLIKGFSYLVNSQAAVSTYMTFRTYADEIHTGNADATIVGSFNNALGPGSQCAKPLEGTCGTQIGGTAGAEQTPLYNAVIGGNKPELSSTASTSVLGSIISSKAYADSGTGSDSSSGPAYRCNDGNPVPASTYPVCPEEEMGQTFDPAKKLSDTLNSTGLASLAGAYNSIPLLHTVVNIGNDLLGWLASGAASLAETGVKALPGGAAVIAQASTEAGKFFEFLGSQVVTLFESSDQSGGRTGDAVILGGAISGYDYAHQGLGGKALSPHEVGEITNQQEQIQQQQFTDRPFFARVFSTDTPDSLISKLADAVPFGLQNELQRGFANLANPLAAISHGFAAIFSGHVSADASTFVPLANPGGVRPYGLTSQDLAPVDTATKATDYWNANCSDNASYAYMKTNKWNEEAAHHIDPNTGQPMNTTVNLCAFLKGVEGSACGGLDTSCLTQDDMDAINGPGGGTTGGPIAGGGPIEQGTPAQLAQKVLDYRSSGKYTCDNSGDCTNLEMVVHGQSTAGMDGCVVKSLDPRVMQLMLYLIEVGNFKIGTYALCSDHSNDSKAGTAGHSGGLAVDISTVNGQSLALDSPAVKQQALAMDKFLNNNLPPQLQLDQQISWGYGGHHDADLADTQQAEGKLCHSSCVGFYGIGVEEEHMDHIHAGFAQK